MKPKPIRDPHGTLLGYQCPECDYTIFGAGGDQWPGRAQADISTHIAENHRKMSPRVEKEKRRRW